MTQIKKELLQESLDIMLNNKHVYGATLRVESGDSSVSWAGAGGDFKSDDSYFVTSVTKLYMTAVLLILRSQGKIRFDDKINKFFPKDLIDGIHVLNGVDSSNDITIAHLLSNTSGIPDYFFGGASTSLLSGNDQEWPTEKEIQSSKTLKPKFMPGQKGKVNYSDTNYALLGGIIEKVTSQWIGDVFDSFLIQPLGLKHTYAYKDTADMRPKPMYYNSKKVWLPRYMSSVTAEGGLVSTTEDVMVFLKAFFNNRFFPKESIDELKKQWNMILFPGTFYFGLGLEKLWTPRLLSPFKPVGEIIGFWGQSGAFAFYNPKTDLYFTGTVNQLSGRGSTSAYKAIVKIVKSV